MRCGGGGDGFLSAAMASIFVFQLSTTVSAPFLFEPSKFNGSDGASCPKKLPDTDDFFVYTTERSNQFYLLKTLRHGLVAKMRDGNCWANKDTQVQAKG